MQRTMILSSTLREAPDAVVVSTPLDLVVGLADPERFATVVLTGRYARDREFAASLGELFPTVRIEAE